MRKTYLDHNATSPLHPRAREAMLPFLGDRFGNPSSAHWAGREVRESEAKARAQAAALINAEPSEVVFTSGGTEGDNLSIRGWLGHEIGSATGRRRHVITTSVEHPAVYSTCRLLEGKGAIDLTVVPVDGMGMVDPDDIRKALRAETAIISVMFANNETGNVFPIAEIARIAREHGALMHTDAVQAVGKLPIDVKALGVDLLTSSGHKFNAPQGVGFQYVRRGVELAPLVTGGGQEGGRRPGTENIPGIVALGAACEAARIEMDQKPALIGPLRDKLESSILGHLRETYVNGHPQHRIYNTSNVSFKYVEGEAVLQMLDMAGIAVSTGSACASGATEPSRILTAMGLEPVRSRGAMRFSLGLGTTDEDIDYCLSVLIPAVERLQKISPFWGSRTPAI